jgi:hypothetical protein
MTSVNEVADSLPDVAVFLFPAAEYLDHRDVAVGVDYAALEPRPVL